MTTFRLLVVLTLGAWLAACGGGGTHPVAGVPTATLQADTTAASLGDVVNLTWSSTDATSCVASDGWSGSLATAGTQASAPLTAATTFSLVCTGSGGNSATSSVVVNLVPTATLTATPASVASGATATLNWSSTDATSCTASGSWSGTLDATGSYVTDPLTTGSTYQLTCSGAGGDSAIASASVDVDVPPVTPADPAAPVPTATLTVSPASITSGGSSTLSWSSTDATACTASGAWSGTKPASGSASTGALAAKSTFGLICTGAGGTSPAASATVAVTAAAAGAPTVTFTATPTSIPSGASSTLTWNSTNATSCTASGGWSGTKATSGTMSTGALSASANYGLICKGSGGSSPALAASVTVVPKPTVTLTASPASMASGAASTLNWSSTNATACTASGGWSGAKAVSGAQSTGALTANSTYTLTCTGTGGSSNAASATVTIVPKATAALTVAPPAITSGGSSTLTWSSTNATECAAAGGWSGAKATSGTASTGALTSNATFTLTCTGTGGASTAASATVTVTPATPGAPTAKFAAAPTSIASGASSTLTWSSTNATACTASGGWTGTKATSGTMSTGALTATKSYGLICTGAGGSSPELGATVTVVPKPTATLTAAPNSLASGGSATLTWSSGNATACTASGGWSGAKGTSGTMSTGALTASATYTLTCTGTGGTSTPASAAVTIVPKPTAAIAVAPTSIASGGSSTLSWSSSNATTCTASGGWSGAKATSGSQSTGALSANTTYTLTCTGTGGTSTAASATVSIIAKPTATLTAAPTSVASGAASTLTWSSTNATACTASGGWSGAKATSGTASTGALTANATYTLTCTGTGGTSTPASAAVTVGQAKPTAIISTSPTAVASGGTSTITWSSTNATACTASGGWTGAKATSGTASTGAVTANTTYSLTCTGTGGTSATVSASVSLADKLAPSLAAITIYQSVALSNTLPAGGATWTVDGIANGNATVGTVTTAGLYKAGTATGRHQVVATSVANTAKAQSAIVAVSDVLMVNTFHNNNARNGTNAQEYALTPATVTAATFGKRTSCPVDGVIIAQPLWMANLAVGGAARNVAFVATAHNGVYAFDADAVPCQTLWHVSLSDAAHGAASGETAVPSALVGAGLGHDDVVPEIGIVGTPVFDPATGILYVVSKTVNAAHTAFYSRLHALDITSGSEKGGSPVLITGSASGNASGGTTVAFDSKQEMQRPGLTLANGVVYVSFGSHEDTPPWFGWVFAYRYASGAFTKTATLNVAPDGRGKGGVWMSGGAPAADTANNLFLLTGNGEFNATNASPPNKDYGDSLLKITPALTISQYWTPSTQADDETADFDFGAGGAAMLADLPAGSTYQHVIVCGGKDRILEVLNRDTLGGYDGPTVQELNTGHSLYATAAFWNNRLYVAGANSPMLSWTLNTSTAQFSTGPASSTVFAFPGASPSISAAGTSNGILWALEANAFCTGSATTCGPMILHAYDALTMVELWKSSTSAADAAGYAVKFTAATIANGRVYVPTRGNNTGTTSSIPGQLDIYGLKP